MKLTHHSFKGIGISLVGIVFSLMLISTSYAASPDEWRCKSYARDAVEQNAKNISAKCGFTGLRWSSDKVGQKKWCLSVKKTITAKEHHARKDMLESCFASKSSRTNPENQPNIPKTCNDPSANYLPIRYLYSEYRYDKELYTPVGSNGLISNDFNADDQKDYVFAEQDAKNNVRLMSCLSTPTGNYQRQGTGVKFYISSYGLSSEQYFVSLEKGLLNININYFGHNEGTCSTNGVYAYKTNKHQFEMVDLIADCSPVIGTDGQPYPLSPPTLPEILRE